ncbi:MAG TPA: cupredoxin domain-containing protein [Candidatus Binataceae bacterium]
MKKMLRAAAAALLIFGASIFPGAAPNVVAADAPAAPAASNGTARNFTVVSVMIDDVKFWLPSTIIVNQGDTVKLTLKNQVPGPDTTHGFTIPAYNIVEVVTRGTPKVVTFTADKPGVFPFSCQLHPAHIGGQLVVHPAATGTASAK